MWSCFSVAQEPIEAAKSKIYKKKTAHQAQASCRQVHKPEKTKMKELCDIPSPASHLLPAC
jgi:hypothetical protein